MSITSLCFLLVLLVLFCLFVWGGGGKWEVFCLFACLFLNRKLHF